MKKYAMVGILIKDRIKEAGKLQGVLSKHGAIIKMRLGSHELSDSINSRIGQIALILGGDSSKWGLLLSDLQEIGGIDFKLIDFEY